MMKKVILISFGLAFCLQAICAIPSEQDLLTNVRQSIRKFPLQSLVKRANLGMVMNCQVDARNCYDDFIKRFERRDSRADDIMRDRMLVRNRLLTELLAKREGQALDDITLHEGKRRRRSALNLVKRSKPRNLRKKLHLRSKNEVELTRMKQGPSVHRAHRSLQQRALSHRVSP